MVGQPFQFVGVEEQVSTRAAQVLLVHLQVVVLVLILYAAHGGIELIQKVGTVLVDREIEFGRAHFGKGHGRLGILVCIQGDENVDAAVPQPLQGLLFRADELDEIDFDSKRSRPRSEQVFLDAALGNADPLAVQSLEMARHDVLVVARDEKAVRLRAHGKRGVQHLFGAVLLVGDIAHQVDFAIYQLLEKLRPVAFDVLVCPTGVSGNLTLILVSVTRSATVLVDGVEGGLVPANADDFLVAFGPGGIR